MAIGLLSIEEVVAAAMTLMGELPGIPQSRKDFWKGIRAYAVQDLLQNLPQTYTVVR